MLIGRAVGVNTVFGSESERTGVISFMPLLKIETPAKGVPGYKTAVVIPAPRRIIRHAFRIVQNRGARPR